MFLFIVTFILYCVHIYSTPPVFRSFTKSLVSFWIFAIEKILNETSFFWMFSLTYFWKIQTDSKTIRFLFIHLYVLNDIFIYRFTLFTVFTINDVIFFYRNAKTKQRKNNQHIFIVFNLLLFIYLKICCIFKLFILYVLIETYVNKGFNLPQSVLINMMYLVIIMSFNRELKLLYFI